LNAASNSILIIDRSGNIVWSNPAFQNLRDIQRLKSWKESELVELRRAGQRDLCPDVGYYHGGETCTAKSSIAAKMTVTTSKR